MRHITLIIFLMIPCLIYGQDSYFKWGRTINSSGHKHRYILKIDQVIILLPLWLILLMEIVEKGERQVVKIIKI